MAQATPGQRHHLLRLAGGAREDAARAAIFAHGLRVAGDESLRWWKERLEKEGVTHDDMSSATAAIDARLRRLGGAAPLLVDDGGTGAAHPWDRSPVPAEHQIRGLGPITISVPDRTATDRVFARARHARGPGIRRAGNEGARTVHVYAMGAGGPAAELHVAVRAGPPAAGPAPAA